MLCSTHLSLRLKPRNSRGWSSFIFVSHYICNFQSAFNVKLKILFLRAYKIRISLNQLFKILKFTSDRSHHRWPPIGSLLVNRNLEMHDSGCHHRFRTKQREDHAKSHRPFPTLRLSF